MPVSSQLKALDSIGIKITYQTYKSFLDSLPEVKTALPNTTPEPKKEVKESGEMRND